MSFVVYYQYGRIIDIVQLQPVYVIRCYILSHLLHPCINRSIYFQARRVHVFYPVSKLGYAIRCVMPESI